jgi:hypothetical protein
LADTLPTSDVPFRRTGTAVPPPSGRTARAQRAFRRRAHHGPVRLGARSLFRVRKRAPPLRNAVMSVFAAGGLRPRSGANPVSGRGSRFGTRVPFSRALGRRGRQPVPTASVALDHSSPASRDAVEHGPRHVQPDICNPRLSENEHPRPVRLPGSRGFPRRYPADPANHVARSSAASRSARARRCHPCTVEID